jgi:hypothetical protein
VRAATREELVVVGTVRRWAKESLPGADGVGDAVVAVALGALAGGASASESCREARRYLESCRRHPGTAPVTRSSRPLRVA